MTESSDFALLHQVFLNLDALTQHSPAQKRWLSQYAFFREQLKSPAVKDDLQNTNTAVRALLEQYAALQDGKVELTRFTCRVGDSLMYQQSVSDELSVGVVSHITDRSIVVGAFEAIEEELLFGQEFIVLELCTIVDVTL